MADKDTNWLDDLFEEIADELTNHKSVKFNTNANRKACIRKIQNSIKVAILENTLPKEPIEVQTPDERRGLTITRPHDGKSQGFAIMTEGMSAQGDEVI